MEWNQVYEKRVSKQHQETKCNFDMIFEWKCTNMRHLWPYWPQIASESQDEFWVRHSKIHQILIRLLRRLLWWSDLKKLGIFWMLTKIQINKTIYDHILINKKLVYLWHKSVYSSRKHPVEKKYISKNLLNFWTSEIFFYQKRSMPPWDLVKVLVIHCN